MDMFLIVAGAVIVVLLFKVGAESLVALVTDQDRLRHR